MPRPSAGQSRARQRNGASPADRPDPTTPEAKVERTGRHGQRAAGPDGPDARAVGDTFKRPASDEGPDQ